MKITCQHFSELNIHTLYKILQLRNEVFVLEQNCPYQDLDDKDLDALHLCYWDHDQLIAYCRLLKKEVTYSEPCISRVIVKQNYRGKGIANQLMLNAIETTKTTYHTTSIRISAQLYLEKFYSNLGFKSIGTTYLEDGIPHIEMVLS